MKRVFIIAMLLLVLSAISASSENIYIPVHCYEVFFVRGTVTSSTPREIVVTDSEGKEHTIKLRSWTGYYPSDYLPYEGDEVNVRCALVNKMTNLVIAEEVQFLKENFKPIN